MLQVVNSAIAEVNELKSICSIRIFALDFSYLWPKNQVAELD